MSMQLQNYIKDVPDFPKQGITFKDLTPLLADPAALQETYKQLAQMVSGLDFDLIVGTESRGFLFGVGLSLFLQKGFVPIRKKGKLPGATFLQSYCLEYGVDALEVKQDAFAKNQKILIVDDLLATGGTMEACLKLVHQGGAIPVACAFVIELKFLNGREKLAGMSTLSLIQY